MIARKAAASPAKLAEREVTRQIKDFLSHRGWRPVRHQRTAIPGAFSTGEPGIPDFQFIHYFPKPKGAALVLWVELKREGARQSCRCSSDRVCTMHQQARWKDREESRGGIVVQAGSLDEFAAWYGGVFGWLHGPAGVGQQSLFGEAS